MNFLSFFSKFGLHRPEFFNLKLFFIKSSLYAGKTGKSPEIRLHAVEFPDMEFYEKITGFFLSDLIQSL